MSWSLRPHVCSGPDVVIVEGAEVEVGRYTWVTNQGNARGWLASLFLFWDVFALCPCANFNRMRCLYPTELPAPYSTRSAQDVGADLRVSRRMLRVSLDPLVGLVATVLPSRNALVVHRTPPPQQGTLTVHPGERVGVLFLLLLAQVDRTASRLLCKKETCASFRHSSCLLSSTTTRMRYCVLLIVDLIGCNSNNDGIRRWTPNTVMTRSSQFRSRLPSAHA
jgi:hypothetical protein